jgi:acetyltransferase-like isoleucine patch superfamily enzyme
VTVSVRDLKHVLRRLPGLERAASFFMADNKSYEEYEVGAGTYGYPEVLTWREGSTLRIGAYCSISARVVIILGGEHRVDWVSTYPFSKLMPGAGHVPVNSRTKGDVVLGSDVWIGEGVCILSGVTIGHGAVVAARSVVAKNVAPYSIVGGNPAKHIRSRFDEDTCQALLEIAWWEWPEEKIRAALPLILSSDIQAFIDRHGPGSHV